MLRDRMCPQCKQKDKFLIYTARWTSVTDDGTDDDDPVIDQLHMDRGLNFADEDSAICVPCGWFGRWVETEIPAEEDDLYGRLCQAAHLLPENEDDPLNRVIMGAINGDNSFQVLQGEIDCLQQALRALEAIEVTSPPKATDSSDVTG